MSDNEKLLKALVEDTDVNDFVPNTRFETMLKACCCGEDCELEPKTRNEYLLKQLQEKLKGGSSVDEPLDITANGVYEAPEGIRYNPINVSVVAEGDRLKALLDVNKHAQYLFYKFNGENADGYISYSDTENVTNINNMFGECKNLKNIPSLNLLKVTSASNTFTNCSALQNVENLHMNNTGSSSTTDYMFSGCTNLVKVENCTFGSFYSARNMFQNCYNLTSVVPMDFTKTNSANAMFKNCYKLETIDISTYPPNMNGFASGCYSLKKLIIRTMDIIRGPNSGVFENCYHLYGTQNDEYNPEGLKDGRIYVPDDKVEEIKAATGWSDFADIIVPLSTLEE